jgi:hypothetical protein
MNRYTFRGKKRPTTPLPEVSISYSSLHSSNPSGDSDMASDADRPAPPMDAAMAEIPRPVIVPAGGAEQAEPNTASGRDEHPGARRDLFPDKGVLQGQRMQIGMTIWSTHRHLQLTHLPELRYNQGIL